MATTNALPDRQTSRNWFDRWNPEDASFWQATGERFTWRALVITTGNLTLAFIVWFLVSALVVRLPGVGFKLSSSQLFWLAVMAVAFWFGSKDDPELEKRRKARLKPESLSAMLVPLKKLQVWRFSLYSFLVFGGFVALALGCRTPGLPGRWSNAPIGKDAL